MEVRKGRCIQVKHLRDYESQYGTMHVFGVGFMDDNNFMTSGEFHTTKQAPKFIEHQEYEYEFHPVEGDKLDRIKVKKEEKNEERKTYDRKSKNFEESKEEQYRSYSLSYAKDVAQLMKCSSPDDVLLVADVFYHYLMGTKAEQEVKNNENPETDVLPF